MLSVLGVIAGGAVGLLRGGRFANLTGTVVRWWPLLVVGVVLQTGAELFDLPARTSLLTIGLFLLLTGLGLNLHLKGAGITMTGLSANLLVLVVNGHVPTRLEALIGVGLVDAAAPTDDLVINDGLGRLETDDTTFAFLGDIVPVGILDDVISFGDLIVVAGLFVMAMHLVSARRAVGIDLDDLLGPAIASDDHVAADEVDIDDIDDDFEEEWFDINSPEAIDLRHKIDLERAPDLSGEPVDPVG